MFPDAAKYAHTCMFPSVDHVAQIVNHLLLLRQMTFHLECMTMDNDPPAMLGIHAESIILNLVNEPVLPRPSLCQMHTFMAAILAHLYQ